MAELAAALSAEERLLRLLRQHHDHHLTTGPIGLQDGEGGWIEIDNGAEYSDSALYERTTAALAGLSPDEVAPMPRGGITAHWWQIGVLERRKRKAAEQRASALAARLAEVEAAPTPRMDGRLVDQFAWRILALREAIEAALLTADSQYVRAVLHNAIIVDDGNAALAQPEGKRPDEMRAQPKDRLTV